MTSADRRERAGNCPAAVRLHSRESLGRRARCDGISSDMVSPEVNVAGARLRPPAHWSVRGGRGQHISEAARRAAPCSDTSRQSSPRRGRPCTRRRRRPFPTLFPANCVPLAAPSAPPLGSPTAGKHRSPPWLLPNAHDKLHRTKRNDEDEAGDGPKGLGGGTADAASYAEAGLQRGSGVHVTWASSQLSGADPDWPSAQGR
jgi:hypothetical protein